MRAYGFVDRGIPKVKVPWNRRGYFILTLEQFDELRKKNPLPAEVSSIAKTILDASRITHVIAGGK